MIRKLKDGFIRNLVILLARIIFRIKVKNAYHVPRKGGALIIANHVSLLDSLLIAAATKRTVRFVIHAKIYNHPCMKWFFKMMNMIPVETSGSMQAMKNFTRLCQNEIKAGHVVCIFPEGQVTRNGQLSLFKKGVEHIKEGINAPIIPIHMDNVIGTPLSFKIGTASKYSFSKKS